MKLFPLLSILAFAWGCNGVYLMYLTGQHNLVPEPELVTGITHVALAFMRSSLFNNEPSPIEWPLFTNISAVRSQFAPHTSIMVAIGGWGDVEGFEIAAATDNSRKLFAKNVKAMIDNTGADGVDIDWEYPGGNGEDYKQIPNSKRTWEIEAYPKLLAEIRSALGPTKVMSAAVPGLKRDMLAFTNLTVPDINESLDFFNIMTYDLMNRRDTVTKHHTGIQLSLEGIDAYLANGVPSRKANVGLAFYVKWYKTDPKGGCAKNPVGCKTVLMEDPVTGADLGQAGAFSWHDPVPSELSRSFTKAMMTPQYDDNHGGTYYWDSEENTWWSWDTPRDVSLKISAILDKRGLGGVFAWGLGEDGPKWKHLKDLSRALGHDVPPHIEL